MNDLPKWLAKLARAKSRLLPLPGTRSGYGVYMRGDRRSRALVCISDESFYAALKNGFLRTETEGFAINTSTRAKLNRAALRGKAPKPVKRPLIDRHVMQSDGMVVTLKANGDETPLARWASFLAPVEMQAGEQLRYDHALSSMNAHTTSNWSPTASCRGQGRGNGPEDASLAAIAAKDRLMDAMAFVGTGLDRLVYAICIREQGMMEIETELGWAQRTGKTVLKMALRRLAEHYGLVRNSGAMIGRWP